MVSWTQTDTVTGPALLPRTTLKLPTQAMILAELSFSSYSTHFPHCQPLNGVAHTYTHAASSDSGLGLNSSSVTKSATLSMLLQERQENSSADMDRESSMSANAGCSPNSQAEVVWMPFFPYLL